MGILTEMLLSNAEAKRSMRNQAGGEVMPEVNLTEAQMRRIRAWGHHFRESLPRSSWRNIDKATYELLDTSILSNQPEHVDVIAIDHFSGEHRLIKRVALSNVSDEVGKQVAAGTASYVMIGKPHTATDCPFPYSKEKILSIRCTCKDNVNGMEIHYEGCPVYDHFVNHNDQR